MDEFLFHPFFAARLLELPDFYLILTFLILLSDSCIEKHPAYSDCSGPPDKMVLARFDSSLGNVSVQTKLFHPSSPIECEIGINDSLDVKVFHSIDSSLKHLLGYGENANSINKSFTIYLKIEIEKDSVITLNNVAAIGRYYLKEGKLYHQLFIKTGGSFSERKELSLEVDGVIYNYMHKIAKDVLMLDGNGSCLFIKTSDSKNLFKDLRDPKDELGWRLR